MDFLSFPIRKKGRHQTWNKISWNLVIICQESSSSVFECFLIIPIDFKGFFWAQDCLVKTQGFLNAKTAAWFLDKFQTNYHIGSCMIAGPQCCLVGSRICYTSTSISIIFRQLCQRLLTTNSGSYPIEKLSQKKTQKIC